MLGQHEVPLAGCELNLRACLKQLSDSTEPGLCLCGLSCPRVTLLLCRFHVQNQTQQHQQTTGQAQAQNQQQTVAQQATSQQTSAQTNGTTGATGGTVGGALQHGQDQAPANKKPRIGPSGAPTATGMLQSEYQVSVTLSGMQSPASSHPLETNRNDPRTFPQQITQQSDRECECVGVRSKYAKCFSFAA